MTVNDILDDLCHRIRFAHEEIERMYDYRLVTTCEHKYDTNCANDYANKSDNHLKVIENLIHITNLKFLKKELIDLKELIESENE